jgi:hypothetical protein
MDRADSRFGSPNSELSLRLVVRTLHMSIALGESRRDVYVHPYFRGRPVCSRADVEIGCLLTSQAPDSLGMLPSTVPLSGGRGANRASCVRLSLVRMCHACGPEERTG